jgi:hypothetical protein
MTYYTVVVRRKPPTPPTPPKKKEINYQKRKITADFTEAGFIITF